MKTRLKGHGYSPERSIISELKMRRFCQHQRRPEVNQAVVDGVSRSCLKSQTAVEKASRS